MKKDKLVIFLTVTELLSVIALIALFIYKCTFIISWESNISIIDWVFKPDSFLEYSFLDCALKFNLIFIICLSIVLLVLKLEKTDKCRKIGIIATVILLVLSTITNTAHVVMYEHATRNEIWDFYSTGDEEFQPIPAEYSKYFPYFNMMDEITDKDVSYEYMDTTTYLGRYISMNTWCYDLEVSFSYEEMQTKSEWLMNQFIFTKGKPNYVNDDNETVFLEPIQNEEYGCTMYQKEDFYELWFISENNCVIIKYENFDGVLNISEEDILKDAKKLYESLKMD